MTPEKNVGGRPTEYHKKFSSVARKLVARGASDTDLAEFFEITSRTLRRWRTKFPEFGDALKQAKNEFDNARVERAAFHRAIGYEFESEKVFQYKGEVVRAKTVEHVPPDPSLLQFWLTNRNPAEWRHKSEITGQDGGPIQTIDVSRLTPVERAQRIAALFTMNGRAGPVIDAISTPAEPT